MTNPKLMARYLPPILTCLAGLVLASGCNKPTDTNTGKAAAATQPQVVEVTPLVRRDLAETLNLVGSLQANESAEIRAELGGLVRAIYFEEGQRVKAGEILLKIDDAELQAQYAQVEARFKLAELNVARSE
ncbi:MAG: biotin/lipoyl-binding protein, partial [Opitutaceae bacterium]|nr:biotin/lipoyl-binding protein [Opitutaceae bacterium]